MAAASEVFNDPKSVAADLLANTRLTELLYTLIKAAAGNVYVSDKVYAYPVGDLAAKRYEKQSTISSRYRLGYHPDDITIVGGMALALYDDAISHIKKDRKLGSLEEFLTKNTSDIDMVWWPRIFDSEPSRPREIITINSPAIKERVLQFKQSLQSFFQNREYVSFIMQLIPDVKSLQISVIQKNVIIAGVSHILIYFDVTYQDNTSITLEMCDISIHDGGSSQITMGPQGAMLSPMENDPIYVSDMFQQINRIKIRKIEVHVPILLKLIDQQLLAFSNVLMKRDNKCIIIYNRLRYIQFVLAPRNINRPRLLAIFGISEQIVNPIIVNIDKELNRIISEQCSNNTVELCMKLNKYELMNIFFFFILSLINLNLSSSFTFNNLNSFELKTKFNDVSFRQGLKHIHTPELVKYTHYIGAPLFNIHSVKKPMNYNNITSVSFNCSVMNLNKMTVMMHSKYINKC